jgi:hypothetical protein
LSSATRPTPTRKTPPPQPRPPSWPPPAPPKPRPPSTPPPDDSDDVPPAPRCEPVLQESTKDIGTPVCVSGAAVVITHTTLTVPPQLQLTQHAVDDEPPMKQPRRSQKLQPRLDRVELNLRLARMGLPPVPTRSDEPPLPPWVTDASDATALPPPLPRVTDASDATALPPPLPQDTTMGSDATAATTMGYSSRVAAEVCVQSRMDRIMDRMVRCASPHCTFMVHTTVSFGSYCCKKCHYRHIRPIKGRRSTSLATFHGIACQAQCGLDYPRAQSVTPPDVPHELCTFTS